jgi:flagellin
MSSINTNLAAITALQNLNKISKSMLMTQNQISTGYRVASASDNAAYWSIATTMRSDKSALGAVSDSLGLGAATVDTQYTAMQNAINLVDQIKTKLVAAKTPGVDRVKIQSEISQLQSQAKSVADSATFSGQNWLSVDTSVTGYTATKSIVASFTRSATGVNVGTISFNSATSVLYDSNSGTKTGIMDKDRTDTAANTFQIANIDISALSDSTTDQTKLSDLIQGVDNAISEMTTAATNLGSVKTRVGLQRDFVTALMGAIDSGVGTLVDADMNEASTKYQALQVQQQLGVQALSIANSSSQSILSLFR